MRFLRRISAALCLAVSVTALAERFQNPTFQKTNGPFYQVLAADLTGSGRQDFIYWTQWYDWTLQHNVAQYQVMRNDGGRQFTDLGPVSLPYGGLARAQV